MLKKLILFILILTSQFLILNSSSAQSYQWAHGFGGPNSDAQGNSIATDAQGNVYVTGTFADSIDFDPSTSGTAYLYTDAFNLTSFIAKYDSSGNYIWAKSLNASPYGNCWAEKIVVNNTGIYLTGHFALWIDFDPDPGTSILSSTGGFNGDEDIFIAHYDLSGNYLWAKSMGGLNEEKALDMAVDNIGNSYITGYFRDTVDLDPDFGTAILIANGIQDAFFAKYDNNGNYQWAYDLCDNAGVVAMGRKVAFDYNNFQVYFIGEFNGTVDFDRGATIYNISSVGGYDSYVLKMDSSGGFIWAGTIETPNSAGTAANIAVQDTNLYLCGIITDITDFDIGSGVYNVTPSGTNFITDMFFAKYNLNGSLEWVKTIGNAVSSQGLRCIKIDSLSNIFLSGTLTSSLDFDPGSGISIQYSNGNADIAFAKYDSNFNFLWARNIGGAYSDVPLEMNIDYQNNLLITGYFQSSSPVDFDPDLGTAFLNTGTGNKSIFIAKYQNIATGIFNQFENNTPALIVYPNPAKVKITIGNLPAHVEELTITNSMRVTVWLQQLANQTQVQLPTEHLAPGLYTVSVKTKKEVLVKKFVKVE